MTITELREAFAAWPSLPKGCAPSRISATEILSAITDPAPITEEGLRELGFAKHAGTKRFWTIDLLCLEFEDGEIWYAGRPHKTLGRLRLLLLSVGE